MEDGDRASPFYLPCIHVAEQCPSIGVMDEGGGVGEVDVVEKSVGKRRRGRPSRIEAKAPPTKKRNDGEDVCFICFDGGSLVLCDRRGCPKAYHPTCIKRSEEFFQSKAKWNCGWHICSSCQKASHYMCYTCTYSLCKGCTKDADYLCVRGNKGFCGTCMKTVMLIENNVPGNKEMVQVDFDDSSSWEYLFKVYWVYLKEKLDLTFDELSQAKNPWKGSFVVVHKVESTSDLYDGNGHKRSCPENSCGVLEANKSKRRKTTNPSKIIDDEESLSILESGDIRGTHLLEGTEWASKELLEFVAHMKNGDISVLSQFDVQALLLEYIKRNSLRDPRRKCQILCDSRLLNLFGRERVGHFEMLKLLESHFLIKGNSSVEGAVGRENFDDLADQAEFDWNNDNQLMVLTYDKKHKARKKTDEKAPKTNADEFAAIDVHNINLIYLPRNLMEKLIDDAENFHDEVVGSIVRIRICSSDQKQDMYRLVQVVGTSKVAEPYNIGTRSANVMLEILNLDKKEVISIDGISNQEFSKDECRRLRQSVKCGLINWWTVGDIQEKARTLQAVRVNDGLEAEILRLSHLRDRASEKGQRKELRECVEKLELLNSPEERQRRLVKIPEVHTKPNTDPGYESEDAGELPEKNQDDYIRPRNSGCGRKGRKLVSPLRGDIGSRSSKNLASISKRTRNTSTTFYSDKEGGGTLVHENVNGPTWNRGREACVVNSYNITRTQIDANDSVTGGRNNEVVVRTESFSMVASDISLAVLSTGMEQCDNSTETEKCWHYQDPNGRIQGPFSMMQLRKWSASGHFPLDLRIWKMDERQDDSILLIDALGGRYYKDLHMLSNKNLLSQEVSVTSDDRNDNLGSRSRGTSPTKSDTQRDGGSWNSKQSAKAAISSSKTEFERSNGGDSLKGNNFCPDQAKVSTSLISPACSKACGTLSHKVKESRKEFNSGHSDGNLNSHVNTVGETDGGHSSEKRSESDLGQSSGQNWRLLPLVNSSNGWDSNTDFVSLPVSLGASEQKKEIDFPDLPSPTPNPSNGDSEYQAAEDKQSLAPKFPVPNLGPSWSSASSLIGGGVQLSEVANELDGYSHSPVRPSIEEWDSNIVPASSLKPTEVATDHADTPTSEFDEQRHSSPSHPTLNTSSWQILVTEANEFIPLVDESVSDLLAEVEAMESLGGLPSPTSNMNCSGDMTFDTTDCFDSEGVFSPVALLGKGEAMSSTGDMLVTSQSTMKDDSHGMLLADVDLQSRSGGHTSTRAELDENMRPGAVSVNQWEAGSEVQTSEPCTTSWDTANARSEITEANWGQGHANQGSEGLAQPNPITSYRTGQGTSQDNANLNQVTPAGNHSMSGNQPIYNGERVYSPIDSGFRGDSKYGKGRSSWSKHSYFGGETSGVSPRPSPKGQRKCKSYEKGIAGRDHHVVICTPDCEFHHID